MQIAEDLGQVAELCATGARQVLKAILALGPKPDAPLEALLWEQQATRLQGQLNSLTAMNARLNAASVVAALDGFAGDLSELAGISAKAQQRIRQIGAVSELLTKLATVLDLGLALLAASAAPSPATIAAAVAAGRAVAASV